MDKEAFYSCKLFENVQKKYIDAILEESKISKFKPGEYVVHEGDPGDGVYIVTEGRLEVVLEKDATNGEQPKVQHIADINKGEFFGEFCLLESQYRSASVLAKEQSELVFIDAVYFKKQIDLEVPGALEVVYNIAIELTERLKRTNQHVRELYDKTKEATPGSMQQQTDIAKFRELLMGDTLL